MTETIAFFAVGSVAFYILLAVTFTAMCVMLDANSWAGSLVVLGVFIGIIGFWGDGVAAAKWAYHNPTYLVAGLAIYVAVGAGWGVGRWWLEVRKLARLYKGIYTKERKDFLEKHKEDMPGLQITDKTPVPSELREKWAAHSICFRHWKLSTNSGRLETPQAGDYKPEIISWMAFWPVSLIWTILDDFVKELFENIYQATAAWMQRIADREFKNIMETQAIDAEIEAPGPADIGTAALIGGGAGGAVLPAVQEGLEQARAGEFTASPAIPPLDDKEHKNS